MPSQTTISLQNGPDLYVYSVPVLGSCYIITNVASRPSVPQNDFTPPNHPNPRHAHRSRLLPVVLGYYRHLGIPSSSLNLIPNHLHISIEEEEEEEDDPDDNSHRSRTSKDETNTPSTFWLTNIQLLFSFRRLRFETVHSYRFPTIPTIFLHPPM